MASPALALRKRPVLESRETASSLGSRLVFHNPPCRRFLQTAATQYDHLQPEAVNPRCRTVVVSRGYAHPQKPSSERPTSGAAEKSARQHERYRATVARFVAPSP